MSIIARIKSKDEKTCQLPLTEALRSVPIKTRIELEINPTHHRNIPVGRYCHDAAARIEELEKNKTTISTWNKIKKILKGRRYAG